MAKIFHRERRDLTRHAEILKILGDPTTNEYFLGKYAHLNGCVVEGPFYKGRKASNDGGIVYEVTAHELALCRERLHVLLQNPSLGFWEWRRWLCLDVEAAFANPAYPLFLLENPQLFLGMDKYTAKTFYEAILRSAGTEQLEGVLAQLRRAMGDREREERQRRDERHLAQVASGRVICSCHPNGP
jgi:hypothetical protein